MQQPESLAHTKIIPSKKIKTKVKRVKCFFFFAIENYNN